MRCVAIRLDSIRFDMIQLNFIQYRIAGATWQLPQATSPKEPRQVSTFFGYVPDPPAGTRQQYRQAIGQSNEIYQYGNRKLKRKEKTIRNENVEGAESNRKGSRWGGGGVVETCRKREVVNDLLGKLAATASRANSLCWVVVKVLKSIQSIKKTVSVSVQTKEGSRRVGGSVVTVMSNARVRYRISTWFLFQLHNLPDL